MNLEQLKKDVGCRVQLVPVACRLGENKRELPRIDDDWIILEVTDAAVQIRNAVTSHTIPLGKDHVHHFTTNPARSSGGVRYGFLSLNVQVFLQGNECWVAPNTRPGEPVRPRPAEIAEKWIDSRYPQDAGILQKLEAEGYRVAWCLESKLARKTDLEGWEIVVEADARGVPTMFRMKDRPENQTLIKTRTGGTEQTQPPRSVKRCLDCGQDLYLAVPAVTTADAVWLCCNQACPSNRRLGR